MSWFSRSKPEPPAPIVVEIAPFVVKTGDRLILQLHENVTHEQAAEINRALKEMVPALDPPALVLGGGLKIVGVVAGEMSDVPPAAETQTLKGLGF